MRDPEKPLKVFSALVSGLLVVAGLVFFIFDLGRPKVAEAVLEYSAPPDFDPTLLTNEFYKLRKDQGFLVEVAIRSKFAETSDPNLTEVATKLGSRLSFEANWKEPAVSIRFTDSKAATALDVANAAVAVVKERLVAQQQKLAVEIVGQEDAVEDKRKLLASLLKREADAVSGQRNDEDDWGCRIGYQSPIDAKADHEHAVRKLEELRAKPVFSIGSIRAAKVTSD
jgi:hypothetical protein